MVAVVFRFGRRRRDALVQLKTQNLKHTGSRRDFRAKGGRRWKTQNRLLMKDVYQRVVSTKSDDPKPADIRKTTGTMCGEDIKYFPAWRKLQSEGRLANSKAAKAFELIQP